MQDLHRYVRVMRRFAAGRAEIKSPIGRITFAEQPVNARPQDIEYS